MQLAECISKRRKTVENDMPTASYAPFLRFKQSGEFERAKRHVSWRESLEFGVRGWRKSNGVGVGIGVEVFEFFEILLI